MSLREEIDKARLQVHTDSYPMSIGEVINLYQDGEIEIHPEFQRVYRWSEEQKSRLIESVLLGIPLPSIFVSQRDDGVWDVVDGLQRLSTIFSFLGVLKDENKNVVKPLRLQATKYLPSLAGKVWSDPHDPESEIDIEVKRVFKREKLDIKIIKRESESDTKFELFQRLNTGGSRLSDQEVRNCMLLMVNNKAYFWLKKLAEDDNFISTIPISDKQKEECYDQELAFRFVVQRHLSDSLRKEHTDVNPYLNAELNRIFSVESAVLDYDNESEVFRKTFEYMNLALEERSFKKYNHDKAAHKGAVSIAVFEALSSGLSKYLEKNPQVSFDATLCEKIQKASIDLTKHERFIQTQEKSARPLERIVVMGEIGQELFR